VVRIRFPPAESPSLAKTRLLKVEYPRVFRGVRRQVGGAVGRDAQGSAEIARTGPSISVSPFSSTAAPLMWSSAITAFAA
jgi:hypothetical protein